MRTKQASHFALLTAAIAGLALGAAAPALAQLEPCPADLTAVIGPVEGAFECASPMGTDVQLDGTGSSVGTNISYLWTTNDGAVFDDDTSLTPIGTFGLGTTEVTLTVTCVDDMGEVSTQAMTEVEVEDTTPPTISAYVDRDCLWPPNHKYQTVNAMLEASDSCDPNPVLDLDSVVSNEPDNGIGDGNTTQDILLGSDDLTFDLRSERQGPNSGRVYTATWSATDASGNFSTDSVMIIVPHDMGGVDNDSMCKASNQAAEDALSAASQPPDTSVKNGKSKKDKSNKGNAKGKSKSSKGKAKGKNK